MIKKNLKITVLILIILIFNTSLFSQIIGKIEGKVTDIQTGFPIENVNVFLENTNYGTVTDANGNFEINNIRSGEYKMIFSHISYIDEIRTIEVMPEKRVNLTIEMSINIIQLKGVVAESQVVHSFINKLPEEKKDALSDELADVYSYMLLLAHETGIDLDQAFKKKIEINNKKYPISKSLGNSKKYTEFD